jgi:glycosyltransferase involved in cell wall biosynthesis
LKDLSFVLIGRNAEWSIARLLDSVIAHAPSHLSTEILYVDSASTDRTIDIVSQYPATILKLSDDQPLSASAGRYIGTRYATGKYIYFLDSDMELLDGWITQALKELDENPRIAVITGSVVETDVALKATEIPVIDYSSYNAPRLTDVASAGGASIFRHSVLSQVGTWNPYLLSDEEPELCLRIRHAGYRIVRLEYPMARHYTTPYRAISTVLARRKRQLYLGFGQTIRYHLNSGLLLPYLKERGYGLLGAAIVLLAIGFAALAWALSNALWLLAFGGLVAIVIVLDAIRTRSFYWPLFHLLHRAVALEGMVRGFWKHPYAPHEFPGKVTVVTR